MCESSIPMDTQIERCQLVEGRFVGENKSINAWNLKSWLTGVHHHCSDKNMQNYLNEFSYKFCQRHSKNLMFHTIIKWMVISQP